MDASNPSTLLTHTPDSPIFSYLSLVTLPNQRLQKRLEGIKASRIEERQVLVDEISDNPELQKFIHAAFEEINSADSAMDKYWVTYSEMVEILFMNCHTMNGCVYDNIHDVYLAINEKSTYNFGV